MLPCSWKVAPAVTLTGADNIVTSDGTWTVMFMKVSLPHQRFEPVFSGSVVSLSIQIRTS